MHRPVKFSQAPENSQSPADNERGPPHSKISSTQGIHRRLNRPFLETIPFRKRLPWQSPALPCKARDAVINMGFLCHARSGLWRRTAAWQPFRGKRWRSHVENTGERLGVTEKRSGEIWKKERGREREKERKERAALERRSLLGLSPLTPCQVPWLLHLFWTSGVNVRSPAFIGGNPGKKESGGETAVTRRGALTPSRG